MDVASLGIGLADCKVELLCGYCPTAVLRGWLGRGELCVRGLLSCDGLVNAVVRGWLGRRRFEHLREEARKRQAGEFLQVSLLLISEHRHRAVGHNIFIFRQAMLAKLTALPMMQICIMDVPYMCPIYMSVLVLGVNFLLL